MIYGSALHATAMSEEEWYAHMQIVKNQYGSEEQISAAEKLLASLRSVLVRLAATREDSYSVVRLGYPALLEVLLAGNVTGSVNVEELARSTTKALVEVRASRLIENLSMAQQSSEFDLGMSETAFEASKIMAEQR